MTSELGQPLHGRYKFPIYERAMPIYMNNEHRLYNLYYIAAPYNRLEGNLDREYWGYTCIDGDTFVR